MFRFERNLPFRIATANEATLIFPPPDFASLQLFGAPLCFFNEESENDCSPTRLIPNVLQS